MDTAAIVKKHGAGKENLLQILHEIQDSNPHNYISDATIKEIAQLLNTTYAQIYGVVTYYSMLSTEKRGRNIIRVCRSPVCHFNESTTIIDALEKILSIKCGETTTDSQFTLETAECLGNCDLAPAMMINKEYYGDLNPEKIVSILDSFRQK